MVYETLGDRCKAVEQIEAGRKADPKLPILARLDGKAFHTWTRGLARPFDASFTSVMRETARFLVEKTHACAAYVQSDEISLVYYHENLPNTSQSEVIFNGKYQKLTSVLASMATAKFNSLVANFLPVKVGDLAFFDCRVWQVPSLEEAANVFLWRVFDCNKNAIASAAQSHFSSKALHGKHSEEMKEMLLTVGIRFEYLPDFFKWGTWLQRKQVLMELTEEERMNIAEKHRPEKGTKFQRSKVIDWSWPPFAQVDNKVGMIFKGETPVEKAASV